MKTIFNIGLGLALAFCIIFFVSGEFEKYIDKKVEAAVAVQLGTVGESTPAEESAAKVVKPTTSPQKSLSTPTAQPQKRTQKPVADNREYIDVRGPKGAVKLYVGQPKDEVLELLGPPDSFDFGGTYEDCSYKVGNALIPNLKIDFERGKLRNVTKYDI